MIEYASYGYVCGLFWVSPDFSVGAKHQIISLYVCIHLLFGITYKTMSFAHGGKIAVDLVYLPTKTRV